MTKRSRKRKAAARLRAQAPTTVQFNGEFSLEAREGRAPRFFIHAYSGEELRVNGFSHAVVIELASARFEDTEQTYINRHHDQQREVGHADRKDTRIDATGVHLEGVISHDNDDTREIITAAQRGKKFKASIEATFPPAQFVANGKSTFVNGRNFRGPVYVARNARITGVAILTRAADMDSYVNIAAKQKDKIMTDELKTFIEAQGFDPEVVADNEDQMKFLEAAHKKELDQQDLAAATATAVAPLDVATKTEPGDWSKLVSKQREAQAAESDRVAEIKRICAEHADPEVELPDGSSVLLASHAIRNNMTPRETLLEAKLFELESKAGGFTAPAFQDATRHDDNALVIECSMAMSAGVTEADIERNKWYDEKIINEATKARFRGYRVSRLAYQTMQAAGIYHPPGQLDDSYISAAVRAHHKLMAAGFTTISLPGIMSNVANKTLLAAYTRAPSMVPFVFGQSSASDFKPMFSYTLEGSGMLEKMSGDSQIPHGAVVESEYTKQLETYSKMLSFTRKDFLNDDMGALNRVTAMLGTMAFKAREYAACQVIANSTMFSVPNNNLLTANPLGIDGLTQSGIVFDGMEDVDGLPISVDGGRILAPSSLKVVTSQLQNQTEIRNNDAGNQFINNPHAGGFSSFNSQWLDNAMATAVAGVEDANRSVTWYRFSDPAAAPAFEVLYLNSVDSPTIQSAESSFNTLGMEWRCYFDFGFGENDPKFAQKNVGV